ncbi:unnamed protein product [Sphacelaria rigidula]
MPASCLTQLCSISNDLRLDAQRDLRDVGCHISVIDGCQGLDSASSKGLGMSKDAKHGCLFSTYRLVTPQFMLRLE